MLDQRVLTSTLREIMQALESSGEQRPPGMIICWVVGALLTWAGRCRGRRVEMWLGTHKWRAETGIDANRDLF
jgi:uroporphyrin-III C-methyltransferase